MQKNPKLQIDKFPGIGWLGLDKVGNVLDKGKKTKESVAFTLFFSWECELTSMKEFDF